MAKIDVSAISGYAEMSAEDKVKALESFEYESHSDEVTKLKNSLNKASSDVAEYKRQLKEKMSEDERKETERVEGEKALREQLAALQREKEISTYKASYLSMGYTDELAQSSAEAMVGGDMATVFANQKSFNDVQKTTLMADLMNKQPGLSTGNAPTGKPDYSSMTDEEYYTLMKLKK